MPVTALWESEARRADASAGEWRSGRVGRALSIEPLFRRRVRSLVVAGVLAFGAVGTGTSVATESDRRGEGPAGPLTGEPAPLPEPPALPTEPVDAPPDAGSPGDPAGEEQVFEPEPVDDPYGRLVLSEEPEAPAVPGDAPAAPTQHPPGDLPGAPAEDLPPSPVAPTPAPTTPAEPVQPPPGTPPNLDVAPRLVHDRREPALPQVRVRGRRKAANRRSATANPPARTQAPVLGAGPTTAAQSTPPAHAASLATAPAPNPPPGIPRFHLVRPGESLWSIAESLLGRRATSPAIAAEVARLWQLNDQRIGTGDPNLLPVGVKLRLR